MSKFQPKGLIGPVVIGLLAIPATFYVGWWSLLITLGFVIGYVDRYPLWRKEVV